MDNIGLTGEDRQVGEFSNGHDGNDGKVVLAEIGGVKSSWFSGGICRREMTEAEGALQLGKSMVAPVRGLVS